MDLFLSAQDITKNILLKKTISKKEKIQIEIVGSLEHFNKTIEFFKESNLLIICMNISYHWTVLFINKSYKKYNIYYFNSMGNNLNNNYFNILKTHYSFFIYFFNKIQIQKDNFNCGVYCIFIIKLIISHYMKYKSLQVHLFNQIIKTKHLSRYINLLRRLYT